MPAQDELDTAKKQVQALSDENKRLNDQVTSEKDDNKRNARYMAMEHAIKLASTGASIDTVINNATKIHDFLLKGPTQTP